MRPIRLLVAGLALAVAIPLAGRAIVVLDGDTAKCRRAPKNGAPWNYVAQLDDANGTGVYLGDRFVITANHVNFPAVVRINGGEYRPDGAWGARQIDGDDLKMIRILEDPGLPRLPLTGPGDADKGRKSILIAWGQGNGEPVPGQGWRWSPPRLERWGANITLPKLEIRDGRPRLVTRFDRGGGPNEGAVANTDSGGGLFQKFDGVWKLAGIIVDADSNASYYDQDPQTAGDQPDQNYYVRIKAHRATIKKIMAKNQ